MGYLTRTIAIARRLQSAVRPILVTMSQGASVAQEFGLHVEFIPFHNFLGVDPTVWNAALREEILALIDCHGARVVVFDGNSYRRPRMPEELKEISLNVGHSHVGRLMRQNGISAIRTRKHKLVTDSNHKFDIAPNLFGRDFTVDQSNQKWAGEISYV